MVDSVELKIRRSAWKYVLKTALVLFGLCSSECITKFEDSINKLKLGRKNQINITNENLRILEINHEVDGIKK